jgi:hypothetical protein
MNMQWSNPFFSFNDVRPLILFNPYDHLSKKAEGRFNRSLACVASSLEVIFFLYIKSSYQYAIGTNRNWSRRPYSVFGGYTVVFALVKFTAFSTDYVNEPLVCRLCFQILKTVLKLDKQQNTCSLQNKQFTSRFLHWMLKKIQKKIFVVVVSKSSLFRLFSFLESFHF